MRAVQGRGQLGKKGGEEARRCVVEPIDVTFIDRTGEPFWQKS